MQILQSTEIALIDLYQVTIVVRPRCVRGIYCNSVSLKGKANTSGPISRVRLTIGAAAATKSCARRESIKEKSMRAMFYILTCTRAASKDVARFLSRELARINSKERR